MKKIILTGLLLLLCACSESAAKPAQPATGEGQPASILVFVGTYTPADQAQPEGIFIYRMDHATGALILVNKAAGLPNPSYLAVDPSRRFLVAVSETSQFNGQPGGGVSSYAIHADTGELTLINSQPTGGADPCFVSFDPSGKWVLVANYTGGSVAVLSLGDDGRLGTPVDVVQHQGSSVNKDRQASPHAHSILVAPGSTTLTLVADLGLDKIMLYDLNLAKGSLTPHVTPWLAIQPGSGPRHMAFHPNHRFLYVTNELNSSVTVFQMDVASGTFNELQTTSLLPADFTGSNASADIHITPDGKYLYASNRGADSLAVFSIDASNGKLFPLGQVSTQGKTPRNFAIDPGGNYLLAANQDSGTIVTFSIDPTSGKLTATGQSVQVPSPVCIQFYGQ